MTEHLGGPESPEKIAERQARYERAADSDTSRVFKVVDAATEEAVGWVGYWERSWRNKQVLEFEYPPGNVMRCNDWRFDLHA